MIVQEPPFAVQVELTEGCNLRCTFCGINGIREKKDMTWKFMSLATAERIAVQISSAGWNSRIEFAMHGEPTLNPEAASIIKAFRSKLPKANLMMLSNGGGLVSAAVEKISQLFAAGLNTLGLDEYKGILLVPRIRDQLSLKGPFAELTDGDVRWYDYPRQPEGNPHQRVPSKRLVFIAPIDESTEGTHADLNTHAGCGAPPKTIAARCAKPFRELSFRFDGNVALCCNDWRGTYQVGSIHDLSIEGIWQHERMQAARKKLLRAERDFGPCAKCDAVSYRPGLLPDKKGQQSLPLPTETDELIIREALEKGPYTAPVMREWETTK